MKLKLPHVQSNGTDARARKKRTTAASLAGSPDSSSAGEGSELAACPTLGAAFENCAYVEGKIAGECATLEAALLEEIEKRLKAC